MSGGEWVVRRSSGPAGAFHDRDVAAGTGREVWVHEVDRPALVLGSTQPWSHADTGAAAARGVEVARRRSGGGAVLVEPGGALWVDVVVPPDDPLWHDDVAVATHWLGLAWAEALGAAGVAVAAPHTGRLVATPWSRWVCFAGLGPGEVTVAGRKAVGLAQRRTRHGARFQTMALLRWEPADLVALLALPPEERAAAEADVRPRAGAVPVTGEALLAALLARLPA